MKVSTSAGVAGILTTLVATLAVTPAFAITDIFVTDGVPIPDQPGSTGDFVSGSDDDVSTKAQIVRGGAVVYDNSTSNTPPTVAVGDVVRVVNRSNGATLVEGTYDGNPALDATACVGSATFTGKRTGAATVTNVEAFKYTKKTTGGRYGGTFVVQSDTIAGEVAEIVAEAFKGTFASAVPAGFLVSASQQRRITPTARMMTTVTRPVTDPCPPPPPVPPSANDVVKKLLQDALAQLRKFRLRTLTAGRSLTINNIAVDRPGDLVFQIFTAKAPKTSDATATAAQKKKAKKKAKKKTRKLKSALIGSGHTVFFAPTTTGRVRVKPGKSAKSILKGQTKAKIIVRSIFIPASGPAVTSDTTVTLKR